jgi:hypothetical protein
MSTDEQSHPAGAPPQQNLETAYTEFLTALWYAFELFKTKGDGGREGVCTACQAAARFIAVRHENPELAAPFLVLRQALIDWENGIQTELLPTASAAKRSRSGLKAHLKRMASACLEVLVDQNEPLETAAAKVARHVDKWPGIGSQKVTANTIQNWRDRERAKAPDDKAHFVAICHHILGLKNPIAEIERLLREGPPDAPSYKTPTDI